MKSKAIKSVLCVLVIWALIVPKNAHAYIDPGVGSIVFQLIIALTLGVAYTLKIYWKKIISLFVKKKRKYPKYEKNNK
jgi:hypothetical protein